jgi:SAM-dependent methyltransferase
VADPPIDALRPTPEAAFAAWAARVRANAEQVERFRELPDEADFYGPVSASFRADPRRTDEPLLDDLLALARPGETWLDIGAGAGRYALPLALRVGPVVAVEPSPGMADALEAGAADAGVGRLQVLRGGWPPEAPTTGAALSASPTADAALIAHLGYDIEAFGSFLVAMERAARRLCAAVLMERQPSSAADEFWPIVHGEERIPLPGLRELTVVLVALGRTFEVRVHERPPRPLPSEEDAISFLRRQLWIAEGGRKDRIFVAAARERLVETPAGFVLRSARTLPVGLVSWVPGRPGSLP